MKQFQEFIRDIHDFPKPGIIYKDISPLLADAQAMEDCTDALINLLNNERIDKVVGIESRGFFFATLLAQKLNAGFREFRYWVLRRQWLENTAQAEAGLKFCP